MQRTGCFPVSKPHARCKWNTTWAGTCSGGPKTCTCPATTGTTSKVHACTQLFYHVLSRCKTVCASREHCSPVCHFKLAADLRAYAPQPARGPTKGKGEGSGSGMGARCGFVSGCGGGACVSDGYGCGRGGWCCGGCGAGMFWRCGCPGCGRVWPRKHTVGRVWGWNRCFEANAVRKELYESKANGLKRLSACSDSLTRRWSNLQDVRGLGREGFEKGRPKIRSGVPRAWLREGQGLAQGETVGGSKSWCELDGRWGKRKVAAGGRTPSRAVGVVTARVRRPQPENGGAQGRSHHQQSQVMLQDRGRGMEGAT